MPGGPGVDEEEGAGRQQLVAQLKASLALPFPAVVPLPVVGGVPGGAATEGGQQQQQQHGKDGGQQEQGEDGGQPAHEAQHGSMQGQTSMDFVPIPRSKVWGCCELWYLVPCAVMLPDLPAGHRRTETAAQSGVATPADNLQRVTVL